MLRDLCPPVPSDHPHGSNRSFPAGRARRRPVRVDRWTLPWDAPAIYYRLRHRHSPKRGAGRRRGCATRARSSSPHSSSFDFSRGPTRRALRPPPPSRAQRAVKHADISSRPRARLRGADDPWPSSLSGFEPHNAHLGCLSVIHCPPHRGRRCVWRRRRAETRDAPMPLHRSAPPSRRYVNLPTAVPTREIDRMQYASASRFARPDASPPGTGGRAFLQGVARAARSGHSGPRRTWRGALGLELN